MKKAHPNQHNIMIPVISADAYQAARHGAAFLNRSARGRLLVSGNDRATYLHGLMTNDIAGLKSGEGCYTAYLTPQGRMIADLLVYELGDAMLLTMDGSVKDVVLGKLEQFIFTEDVKLGDVTETFTEIAVIGPEAGRVVTSVLGGVAADVLSTFGEHGNLQAQYNGHPAILTRVSDMGEAGYEVYVEREQADSLLLGLSVAGGTKLDVDVAESLRVEAGVPAFRRDMDEETIPLEAGIETRAISFSKGCYVGQEVIIRVLHRGHGRVARKLVGLALTGAHPPSSGAVIRAADRDVGRVTSGTISPALGRPIALAYVHRDFLEPGTVLQVAGVDAVVTALPFVPPQV